MLTEFYGISCSHLNLTFNEILLTYESVLATGKNWKAPRADKTVFIDSQFYTKLFINIFKIAVFVILRHEPRACIDYWLATPKIVPYVLVIAIYT